MVVFAVLKEGAERDAEAPRVFVPAEPAPYECPREIVFRTVLPRTVTGGLQRFRLPGDGYAESSTRGVAGRRGNRG